MVDLRKAARDQPCQVRLEGCDGGGETSVLAHIRAPGTGMGIKCADESAVVSCAPCHEILDGREHGLSKWSPDWNEIVLRALLRTHDLWRQKGYFHAK